MKTAIDAIDIVYKALIDSALKTSISGSIETVTRPLGSKLEDVVINSLTVFGDLVQRGFVNVNVYVPDIQVNISGQNQNVANTARLKTLSAIAATALKDHYSDTHSFWISSTAILKETESSHHYVNFRIEFQNVNTSYYE